MAFISLKCPSCGADIELDNSREFGFCSYCGTKLVREKKIVEHRGSVSIDRTNEIKNLLLRGREMYSAGRLADAEVYFNRVLDLDALNKEARDSLACISKTIDDDNVVIERPFQKTMPVFKNKKMYLILNGKKIGFLKSGDRISLKLPIGMHYIEPHFTGYMKNPSFAINIRDRYSKAYVSLTAGINGSVDVVIK